MQKINIQISRSQLKCQLGLFISNTLEHFEHTLTEPKLYTLNRYNSNM